jgi:hypothetical protein
MKKLVFADGCFNNFDGTQEELDEIVSDLREMIATGRFEASMRPLTQEEGDDLRVHLNNRVTVQ